MSRIICKFGILFLIKDSVLECQRMKTIFVMYRSNNLDI